MWGAILGSYGSRGWEAGSLGYPVSAEQCGSACVQEFQYGTFTWSAAKGIDFHIRPDGYCEALNRRSLKYDATASRVSFAIAEGYPDQGITFTNCVRQGDAFRLEWAVPGYAGESGFARPGVASGPTINKYSPTGAFTVTGAPVTMPCFERPLDFNRRGEPPSGNPRLLDVRPLENPGDGL